MLIRVPTLGLVSGAKDVAALLRAVAPAWQFPGRVELDFTPCRFITAEGVAILAGLTHFRDVLDHPTSYKEESLRRSVRENLWKMGFWNLFGQKKCPDPKNSLPIYRQSSYDATALMRYIEGVVMSRSEMPALSPALAREIRRSFGEIMGNVFYHSDSLIGGLVCGQVYPVYKNIQLSFFDAGVGIAQKIRTHVLGIDDDATALSWAVQRGNSTLSISGGGGCQ